MVVQEYLDVVPCRYTYEETDQKIPVIEEPDNELTPEEEEELNDS